MANEPEPTVLFTPAPMTLAQAVLVTKILRYSADNLTPALLPEEKEFLHQFASAIEQSPEGMPTAEEMQRCGLVDKE